MIFKKILFLSLLMSLMSCSVGRLKRFSKCDFQYKGVSDILVMGEKLDDKTRGNALNSGKSIIAKLLFAPEAPISFNVKVQVSNPTKKIASLDKLDWIAMVEGKEVLNGTYDEHFEVKPNSQAVISIPVTFDLKKQLSGENAGIMKKFGMSYFLSGNIKGLTIKVRPYLGHIKLPKFVEVTP